MRATRTTETNLVRAAQAGDPRALDELVTAYLPMVYTVVRRALSGDPDVDDVVQETMLRALRELRMLRAPESFRPWLVAIALHQVGTHLDRCRAKAGRAVALDEVTELPDAGAEVENLTALRVDLSGQRRQVVRASRWLDPDDRTLLSLWWLETVGQLTRAEVAAALGVSLAHAGVRIQRMRHQLELSRSLVAALGARPGCDELATVLTGWNQLPSPLWRKRITRHTRSCPVCRRAGRDQIAPERLLVGLVLLPVPVALAAAVTAKGAATLAGVGAASAAAFGGATGGSGAVGAGLKAGLLGQLGQAIGAHPVVAAVAAGTLVAGATVTTATWPPATPSAPVVAVATPSSAPVTSAAPRSPSPGEAPATGRADPRPTSPDRSSPTATKPAGPGGGPLRSGPVALESTNQAGLLVTTSDDLGVLAQVREDSPVVLRQRATYQVVPGLADSRCVSFRAEDGRYLRHSSWRLRLSVDEGTPLFRGDATFCVRAGAAPGSVSLESANYPGWFVRHRNFQLWVDPAESTAQFVADASFRPRSPLVG